MNYVINIRLVHMSAKHSPCELFDIRKEYIYELFVIRMGYPYYLFVIR